MLVEHLDIEANAFFGGEGVHVAADRIDLAGDIFGATALGPLEHHVLNKVGNAIDLRFFVTGAGLDPNTDGYGADVLHLLGNDGESIGQHRAPNVAEFFNHV